MINYLVNFTLCSALLLLAYQLLLKNKTMYNFNRFYLLFAMLFSLTVPFIVIKQTVAILPSVQTVSRQLQIIPAGTSQTEIPIAAGSVLPAAVHRADINYILYATIAMYSVVTLLLLYRFARNLNTIRQTLLHNQKVAFNGSWLVLTNEELIPHTFLKYIFINKNAYNNNLVEADILKHELTHAGQLHSADVIFMELVQTIFWFNPFIFLYRKAIQLNHEFIADAAVLSGSCNVTGYQHLLLDKLGYDSSLSITSQFNYSATKKRLIMMSKSTSTTIAMLARLAVVPFMAIAFVLFCTKTEAWYKPAANRQDLKEYDSIKIKPPHFIVRDNPAPNKVIFPSTKDGVTDVILSEYKSIAGRYEKAENGRVRHPEKITADDRERMIALYKQMSMAQQQQQDIGFTETGPLPPIPDPQVPTQEQLDLWRTSTRYKLWLDVKEAKNPDLARYKASDFYFAFVYPAQRKAGTKPTYKYTVILWTNTYYKAYKKWLSNYRPETVMFFRYRDLAANNPTK